MLESLYFIEEVLFVFSIATFCSSTETGITIEQSSYLNDAVVYDSNLAILLDNFDIYCSPLVVILLVKRRMAPGKGLWALPGGFLGANERLEDSMLRELEEETRIKVSKDLLRASIKGNHVFDHPARSTRGRTITHAYLIVLNELKNPRVRGSDDAERAKWVPISEFYGMSEEMFEDHYSIGSYMINRAD